MDTSIPIGARGVAPRDVPRGEPDRRAGDRTRLPISTADDVADACALAEAAFDGHRELDPERRALFLEASATRIEALADALVERAMAESGLPRARLTGERGRTTGQLRLFAQVLRERHWRA